MLKRLFCNPRWNESLFLVSCAERLTNDPAGTQHPGILHRIRIECARNGANLTATPCLQFRLLFIHRHGGTLQKEVTFISPVYAAA